MISGRGCSHYKCHQPAARDSEHRCTAIVTGAIPVILEYHGGLLPVPYSVKLPQRFDICMVALEHQGSYLSGVLMVFED